MLAEAGKATGGEAMTPELKGRSKKQADRHYQDMADAEVARIRASVPEGVTIQAEGTCKTCSGAIARFGNLGFTNIGPADHEVKR